jgi:hypothetical protein
MALDKGATIDVVERMVALAKEMRAEQARTEWHQAMAQFRAACPTIRKDKTAEVVGDRSSFTYSYASLPAVMDAIGPVLGKCRLTVTWLAAPAPQGHVGAICVVAHESGHREESGAVIVPIESGRSGTSAAQKVGIAKTYARRYALYDALGIAPDDDDDARSEAPSSPRRAERRSASKSEAPPDEFQAERDQLLIQIGEVADGLGIAKETRASMWRERFGDRKPRDVAPAELADLLAYMRGSVPAA